jgi:hypothetical protein
MGDCGKSFCFTYSFLFSVLLESVGGCTFSNFSASTYVMFGFVSGKYLQIVNKNKTEMP